MKKLRKPLLIHLLFLMIVWGLAYKSVTSPNLTWNITLALIAYDFALLNLHFPHWLSHLFLPLWLLFYPNTFYLLTDIFHMHWAGAVLISRENTGLFIVYAASILFGVFCGIESFNLIVQHYRITFWRRMFLIPSLSLISAFGIYIGRFDRLNSWDVFTDPSLVVDTLIRSIDRTNLTFILGFAFLQTLSLIFMDKGRAEDQRFYLPTWTSEDDAT